MKNGTELNRNSNLFFAKFQSLKIKILNYSQEYKFELINNFIISRFSLNNDNRFNFMLNKKP